MQDVILVLNAGSSSIKFRVFETPAGEPQLLMVGQVEGLNSAPRLICHDRLGVVIAKQDLEPGDELGHSAAIQLIAQFLLEHKEGLRLVAVGHRVAHGGLRCTRPMLVDEGLLHELESLAPLAPLHQPHNLAPIKALRHLRPQLPQVACFDTAFHRSQSELAQAYALPPSITSKGVRRYGFHGLSCEYIAQALPGISPAAAAGRTVVAHLGNGASMCAMKAGRSVASTMGFTAVEGLPMGTRSGSLDPGVILYMMDALQMDSQAVQDMIYKQSGLLGVSGISSDMRELERSSDARARFAIALFCTRIGRELGSLAAALQGLDAIVFTGGIGQHSPAVRERVCRDAAWLGLQFDVASNQRGGPCINAAGSQVAAWVIPTDEELIIARHTCGVLAALNQEPPHAT